MGVKRPFDEETVHELSFKQAKQLYEDDESIPIPQEASEKDVVPALPWVTSSIAEEEAGSDGAYYLPLYPDFVELNIPRRVPVQNEDAYSYLLKASPIKLVPVGPNHQAYIPEWNPNGNMRESFCSNDTIATGHELGMLGTSIIPMPNPSISLTDDANVGSGRNNCTCMDKDSIRCVNKHVQEARQKLRENLGEEKFADLGFHNMGEELANTWTEEEEHVFHKVIYSNPVSHDKDFWKSLSAVFPSRTYMELVSYYFNVFILRRRAVQNRSAFLDIDSDDDEWQGDGRHPEVDGRDDESVVESFDDEGLHVDSEVGVSCDINNDNDDHDDDGNDDDGGNNGCDIKIDGQDDTMKGNQEEQVAPNPIEKLEKDSEVAKVLSTNNNARAGIYLERNSYPLIHESGAEHIKFLGGKMNGSIENLGSGFILEGCDTKAWDYAFSTSHLKSIDLLPTCNMIEEIFGPWNDN